MKTLGLLLGASALVGMLALPAPAQADTADEMAGCDYYSATSMPLGNGLWAGPAVQTQASSACEDINLYYAYAYTPWLRVRADWSGHVGSWVWVCSSCHALVASNVPNGVRARVVFDRRVTEFGVWT